MKGWIKRQAGAAGRIGAVLTGRASARKKGGDSGGLAKRAEAAGSQVPTVMEAASGAATFANSAPVMAAESASMFEATSAPASASAVQTVSESTAATISGSSKTSPPDFVIELRAADYAYQAGTPFAAAALHGVNLRIRRGTLVGIAGGTGSGKSTLLQLLNGLLLPTGGSVRVLDHTLRPGMRRPKLNDLRRRVGLAFQLPERHLFEDTVEKDLMFGPLNFGLTRAQAQARAAEALRSMRLGDNLLPRHPLTLSGGQMRKVAIASVLAAQPEILMLDEPTATLDSAARRELIGTLAKLCREEGRTILMVTHRIGELMEVADEWIVMHEGRAVFQGDADELGDRQGELEGWGVAVPEPLSCWAQWTSRLPQLAALPMPRTAEEMALRIAEAVRASDGVEAADRAKRVLAESGNTYPGSGSSGAKRHMPPESADPVNRVGPGDPSDPTEAAFPAERSLRVCVTN